MLSLVSTGVWDHEDNESQTIGQVRVGIGIEIQNKMR